MPDIKFTNIPNEVRLALEVMPCQANRRFYEPADEPHPCTYFAEWGVYHSFDYASSDLPDNPDIESVRYVGKTNLLPEILSGCRKAPIMSVGINPNLPGYWEKTPNAVNPVFDDYLQYAHYFRYRTTKKFQITRTKYKELLGNRTDNYQTTAPLTEYGTELPVEPVELTMYKSYQELLDGLADKEGWANHKLSVGEDLSYANMVACPSARWFETAAPPEFPPNLVMGAERTKGIVSECFRERMYFLRQLFQSLPVVLFVFSSTTARRFIEAMNGKFITGDPKPNEKLEDLLKREIRLRYGKAPNGDDLTARVIFSPHASANPQEFQKFKAQMIGILSEEVAAGRLVFNPQTKHLSRPLGNCVFCKNQLYSIGKCDYEAELKPLAGGSIDSPGLASAGESFGDIVKKDNDAQQLLIDDFLGKKGTLAKNSPTPSGDLLLSLFPKAKSEDVASLANVDDFDSPACIIRGKIVTMNDSFDVIEDGKIYVNKGIIVDIKSANESSPQDFPAGATVIETNGTIYPGLLDLHNHLAYNVASLWKVPRQFSNRKQWQGHLSYKEKLQLPLGVLAGNSETAKAIVRYVEVKALLGGTTSLQGMRSKFRSTMSSKAYAGVVRNFEKTDDAKLPEIGTQIPDINIKRPSDLEGFRNGLRSRTAFIYHLSEGTNPDARQRFLDLKENNLLGKSLVGIHALALTKDDLEDLASVGGKIVWSPFSNSLLYGKTINTHDLAASKIPFAIGCDWSPSGSKNLLEELKAAWLTVLNDGSNLTFKDLCTAVTRTASQIVGWNTAVGTIEKGKYADFLVLAGNGGDPYKKLVNATETNVHLVMINGYGRCGDADVMNKFLLPQNRLEKITIGGKEKLLFLFRQEDPLKNISFNEAKVTLEKAMGDLKGTQNNSLASSFSFASSEEDFQIELDIDADVDDDNLAGLLATAELPDSIPLDPPVVLGDASHFEMIKSISHLPAYFLKLQDFYE